MQSHFIFRGYTRLKIIQSLAWAFWCSVGQYVCCNLYAPPGAAILHKQFAHAWYNDAILWYCKKTPTISNVIYLNICIMTFSGSPRSSATGRSHWLALVVWLKKYTLPKGWGRRRKNEIMTIRDWLITEVFIDYLPYWGRETSSKNIAKVE